MAPTQPKPDERDPAQPPMHVRQSHVAGISMNGFEKAAQKEWRAARRGRRAGGPVGMIAGAAMAAVSIVDEKRHPAVNDNHR